MISLEKVSFAYEHGPYLLQDVTMTVQDGDYISVIGAAVAEPRHDFQYLPPLRLRAPAV